MFAYRFSAPFFMLVGILLALVLPLGDSARAISDTLAAANRGLGPSTAFTYQGELQMDGAHVSGTYDFQFSLWDAASGGSQTGSTVSHADVTVNNGRFTVLLDFGDVFDGSSYYLEIAVRPGDSSGAYTTLSPRQALTATPYASHAGSAPWAGLQDVPPGFADNVDGVEYANVIVVAKSGGDYTTIKAAIDSIPDAAADNPYLVWVAPGLYEEQVTLKPYMTLEGAGEGATIVRGSGGNEDPYDGPESATLVGADNATVRHLTVESDAASTTNDLAVAIWNNNASPTLVHITATAAGGTAFHIGVFNDSSSSPTMTNVTVTASGNNQNYGVYNTLSSPTMTNVTASATGGDNNYGVYNILSSSPTMTNVTATGEGGSTSYGVVNIDSSPTMTNVTASATGGDNNYGVYNVSSSPVIRDSRLEGDDSIYRVGSGTVQVANSQLVGDVSSGLTCYDNYDENLAAVACP